MSKRRRGYPSERAVKRGKRVVHGHKELTEKLGKDDPCPCGSGRRFQAVLTQLGQLRRLRARLLLLENSGRGVHHLHAPFILPYLANLVLTSGSLPRHLRCPQNHHHRSLGRLLAMSSDLPPMY
ncbi:MAG TPA: SEC-C metal-binding domain-containing protein [Chloroflexia bacterium]|nr:SEC-C metal-binding domain-containing protein [Chloroflexia bacterium]